MSTMFVRNKDVKIHDSYFERYTTGIEGLDKLFENGIMPGSVITVCGMQGSGKTQLMLQLLNNLGQQNYKIGYASCEEVIEQLAYTCNRINVDIPITTFTGVDFIMEAMKEHDVLVVDSFSMISLNVEKGVRKYERELVDKLYEGAKANKCTLFIIVHQTKNGDMKGSTYLPHKVDATLYVDRVEGEGNQNIRKWYFNKNRFGPLSSINFTLTSKGFDFYPVDIVPVVNAVEQKSNKSSKKDSIMTQIMQMNKFTVHQIMDKFKISLPTANNYLTEHVACGRLEKVGRGTSAEYIRKNK